MEDSVMQVSVETTGKLEREMRVAVPEERIAGEVQNRLARLSRTTKVAGFRPGKAPLKVIEQRYGKRVREEVVGEVVQSSFYEAIAQEKLRPAGSPSIHPLEAEQGQGLTYTARFEVYPEIQLQPVEGLEIEKAVCEIDDDDIDRMIEVLRKQRAQLQEVDRPARSGDTVEIDFTGSIEGEPFEGGSGSDFRLELGSGRFIEGFEQGLIGKAAGEEATLDLTFPGDYQDEKLAGKPVQFQVQVKKVLEAVPPELNEEFFAQFGVTEGGEAAFHEELRSHMEREAESAVRNRQRQVIMDALVKANPIDVPNSLIHEESHRLLRQFQSQLKAYGIADEKGLPDDTSVFEERAAQRVATQLIVLEIIRSQGFEADPGRVREMIEKNAENYEDPAAVINWYYQDKQRLAEVEAVVLEDQVIDWVMQNAAVKEAKVSFDELVNKGQTDAD
jgi:trigger factor